MEDRKWSGLFEPDYSVANKDGIIFFRVKSHFEDHYYLFELKLDLLPLGERAEFKKYWKGVKRTFRESGIALFDIGEILDALKALPEKDIKESAKVDIRVFNHATGKIKTIQSTARVPIGLDNEAFETARPLKGPL